MLLLDVTKCYENVNRHELARLARALHFPPVLLRLSIQSYAWPRRVVLSHDIVSAQIPSDRGIAAGSIFACYEIGAYVVQAVDYLGQFKSIGRQLTTRVLIHVDDLQLYGEAESKECLVDGMAQLSDEAAQQFSALDMHFSESKAVTVATSPDVARRFMNYVGRKSGTFEVCARNLGCDMQFSRVKQRRLVFKNE